jgi:sugar transferase EpsL
VTLGPLLALLALPVVGVLAVLVRLKLGRPVLFRQQRAGLGGTPFTLWKLRTMTDERDEAGRLLPDEDRLGPFGRWLRSSSLDELPELWNVVRGEMSLVGPRPLPLSYLTRYMPEEARRHEVRPGLTGWAQINGRNTTSWDERLAMDVWYVDSRSFWLDVRILAQTVWIVFRRSGVSAENHATMPELRPESQP